MSDPQRGINFRYFSVDSSHNISSDTVEASLDETAWVGLDYVEPADYPPEVTALATTVPVAAGKTRYWWRCLTGPGQVLPLRRGTNCVYGRVTDNPEIPNFAWIFHVGDYD